MDLLIFKTNIKTKKKVKSLSAIFNSIPAISDWSIDLEDIDKVLRIESTGQLGEHEVIKRVNTCGFHCEILMD